MCRGETWWNHILLTKLYHPSGPWPPPAQVEAAREDPPCPSRQLRHPSLRPTACPKGIHAGQDERRHSASPPPAPPSPEHRQPVQEGLARGRKSPHLSVVAGRSVPGKDPVPACSGQPDRPRAERGGEQSLASWHGRHRGVPAQVPGVEPGEEVQEGQEVTRGLLSAKAFCWLPGAADSPCSLIAGHDCPQPR